MPSISTSELIAASLRSAATALGKASWASDSLRTAVRALQVRFFDEVPVHDAQPSHTRANQKIGQGGPQGPATGHNGRGSKQAFLPLLADLGH